MRWLVTVLLVSALTACAAAPNDPYPMPSGSPTMWQNNPARLGEAVRGVMLYITPRAGDRIELLSAEPVGETHGAHVEFWLSRPVPQTDGSLVIGEDLERTPLDRNTPSGSSPKSSRSNRGTTSSLASGFAIDSTGEMSWSAREPT